MDTFSSSRDEAPDDLLDRVAAPAPLSVLVLDAALQEATRAARLEAAPKKVDTFATTRAQSAPTARDVKSHLVG